MSKDKRYDNNNDNGSYYPYDPSVAAAVIFVVAFAAVLIYMTVDYIRFRQRRSHSFPFQSETPQDPKLLKRVRKEVSVSLIPVALGLFFQVLGYITRIVSVQKNNLDNLNLYIIPTTFTLVSPSLLSGGIFMIFTRLERSLKAEMYSIMPTRFSTIFFVTGDVTSFLVQAVGGALSASDGSRDLGLKLSLVGFGMQIFFFLFFIAVASVWYQRISKNITEVALLIDINELGIRFNQWRRLPKVLIACMTLVLIRCILRMVEFGEHMGSGSNKLGNSEAAYYMIDPFLIFWACVLLAVSRPEYRLWEMKAYQVWNDSAEGESPSSSNNGFAHESFVADEAKL